MASRHFDFRPVILNLASDLGKAQLLLLFSDGFGSQGLVHVSQCSGPMPLSSPKLISTATGNRLR